MRRKHFALAALAALVLTSCHEDKTADNGSITVSINELGEAFNYAFPLVIMDATKTAETNAEVFVPGMDRAPVNQFIHAVKPADASGASISATSVDTYCSRLWMDLSQEPLVLEFPDIEDRICNIQVLDAWTNTTKVIQRGGTYVFAQKGQRVRVPAGAKLVVLPTAMNWAICRIADKGESDYATIEKIREEMMVYPLSAYGDAAYEAPRGRYYTDNDFNPVQKCLEMSASEFFAKANELMVENPPLSFDAGVMKRLKHLGVGPGLEFKGFENDELIFKSIKAGFKVYASNVELQKRTNVGGMWSYFVDPSTFGTDYDYRAAVAMVGLAHNTTETICPRADKDYRPSGAYASLASR